MVDLRAALRPLVDEPAAAPLPVAELAVRARRRTMRRRTGALGVAAAFAVVLGVVATHDPSNRVATADGTPSTTDAVPAVDPPATDPDSSTPASPVTTVPAPTQSTQPPPTQPDESEESEEADRGEAERPASGEPTSPVAGVAVTSTTTSSWDGGHCVEIRVENGSGDTVAWLVTYAPAGTVATMWNSVVDHEGAEGTTFVGEGWNNRLAPGEWTTFGVCIDA